MSQTFPAAEAVAVKVEPAEGAAEGAEGADGPVVGRLVDCSQADDRKMIRLVRARRLLYARNNMPVASFHTQVKHLWQEVAREMGWSGTSPHTFTFYYLESTRRLYVTTAELLKDNVLAHKITLKHFVIKHILHRAFCTKLSFTLYF